jgi:hypothetical protein
MPYILDAAIAKSGCNYSWWLKELNSLGLAVKKASDK